MGAGYLLHIAPRAPPRTAPPPPILPVLSLYIFTRCPPPQKNTHTTTATGGTRTLFLIICISNPRVQFTCSSLQRSEY